MNDGTLRPGESLDVLEASHACMPSDTGLLEESTELSSPDCIHHHLINIIDPEIPLVGKYGPSMKEAVDRYNRHGEEFNALVHQQHLGHSPKRPAGSHRIDLLVSDASSRELLVSGRIQQLKRLLKADYLQLQDICRANAGRQLMDIPEQERDDAVMVITAIYAEHALLKQQLDETWKYTDEQKREIRKQLAQLPEEADLADQIERLVRDIDTHRGEATKLKGDLEKYQKRIADSPDDSSFFELRLNTCWETLETEEKYLAEHQNQLAESGRQLEHVVGLKVRLKTLENSRQEAQAKVDDFWLNVEESVHAPWEQKSWQASASIHPKVKNILNILREDVEVLVQCSELPWVKVNSNQQEDPTWYYFALVQCKEY
ncbi:hypothetical protein [Endozoicomonas elysicola]|uniref:Uncharacterized protein n=1 Tax=Endozoicomonas elysicola TaxID=305900 RepID=A0A081KAM4_9GAMM|nr:hypothetical protein [Endozoicomonas elysicola]KEI71200.1 hypothetical protein GV64_11010 [Endozoicomonas elysicola]